ncbi:unnamed protein product [Triticum turgidum subsp. durum]|uniref:Expansin-like CBD domain-containing protein n=1 Tax=Triticum turgidum subsp. durum TaxID=4567 RepID=A0A9R0ZPP8_TRITD|nr:unnamed protein product [Triticum turgidum subsp. durum]
MQGPERVRGGRRQAGELGGHGRRGGLQKDTLRVQEQKPRGEGGGDEQQGQGPPRPPVPLPVEVANAAAPDAAQSVAAPSQTKWQYMTGREGSPGVWRTSHAPAGPLRLRLVVTAGSGGKWLLSDGAVLPAEWHAGAVYGTGMRVTEVAANTCGSASCGAGDDNRDDD